MRPVTVGRSPRVVTAQRGRVALVAQHVGGKRRLRDLALELAVVARRRSAPSPPKQKTSTPYRSASSRYSGSAVGRDVVGDQGDGHAGQGLILAGLGVNVLILHNRYREPGGEERSVAEIATLLRERGHARRGAGARERGAVGRLGPAARRRRRCSRVGWLPVRSREAVRRTGADIVHAHNVYPLLGLTRPCRGARAGAARRHAPAQLPAVLLDRRSSYRDGAICTRCRGRNMLPGRATALSREPARGGNLRRRAVAPAASGSLEAVGRFVAPSAFAARPPGGAGPAARPHLRCAQLPARERVRRPRRRTAGPSTRCTPGGWWRRRASTRRSRRPRAPASRWRSPAPVPRPSRCEALAAEHRGTRALPRPAGAGRAARGARARGLRGRALALGRAMPVLGDRGDGGRRPGARVRRGGLPEMVGERAHAPRPGRRGLGAGDAGALERPGRCAAPRGRESLDARARPVRARALLRRADGCLCGRGRPR